MARTVNRALTVAGLSVGAFLGWFIAPFWAYSAGLAPWWAPLAFMLATGPVRWVRWVIAGAWEESRFDVDATGDNGASWGPLQFQGRAGQLRTAAVRPDDVGRRSAFWSALYAPALTVAHLWPTPSAMGSWDALWQALYLRAPILGYLSWRLSWRTGRPVKGPSATLPETTQAREGLAVDLGLAVLCYAVLGMALSGPLGVLMASKTVRRRLRAMGFRGV